MKVGQFQKSAITFSASLFVFIVNILCYHFAMAEEWQREYGAIVDGEYLAGAFLGGESDPKLAFVDIDDDGYEDMFIGGDYGRLYYFHHNGVGISQEWVFVSDNYNSGSSSSNCIPGFCDIDNDGDYDMFVVYPKSGFDGKFMYYRNDGNSSNPIWTFITDDYGSIPANRIGSFVFCDIDNDDDNDLFFMDEDGTLEYYKNVGTPSSASWQYNGSFNSLYDLPDNSDIEFCDIDNDSDYDMFIKEGYEGIRFYRNTGTANNSSWHLETINYAGVNVDSAGIIRFSDIDGDNDFDLFVSSRYGVALYRNIGTSANASFILETEQYGYIDSGVASTTGFCDIDADGDYDMFINSGNFAFYRNVGTKTAPLWSLVTTKYDILESLGVYTFSFCDIDKDNDLDLFIGNRSRSSEGRYGGIRFYRNDGTSNNPKWTFVTNNYNSIIMWNGCSPSFCDIDGDGDYDLFIGDDQNCLWYYRNDGTVYAPQWTFVADKYISIPLQYTIEGINPIFCDIDLDGDKDLFVGDLKGRIHYFRNDGTPEAAIWTKITDNYNSIDVGDLNAPVFADIDGDGDPDMFAGELGGGVNFWRNITIDIIPPGPVTNFSAQPGIEHILLNWTNPTDADWAGTMIVRKEGDYPQNSSDGNIIYDGKNSSYMDIMNTLPGLTYYYTAFAYDIKRNYSEAVPSAQGMAAALESPFKREYGAKVNGMYMPGAYLEKASESHPIFTDIDNDGDMDMLVGTKEGHIYFYCNNGGPSTPGWVLASTAYDSDKGLYGGAAIALCDIDNDGDKDMFTGGQDGTVGFYRKEGDLWMRLWDFGPIDVGNYSEPALCDIDGDGDYDMFVGEQYGHIYFYRNDGSVTEPSFVLISSSYESLDAGDRSTPAFCDIDNDDDYDMFIGNSAGKLSFYRNDGTLGAPSWTFVTNDYDSIDVGNNSTPAFCDIDSDGDYDMFAGNGNGDILFYENNGSSVLPSWDFVINYTHIDVVSNSVPVFCDIDGDGDCDMFISNWNGAVTFYRNDGTKASPSWTFVTDKYNSIEHQSYIMPSFCDIDNDGDYDMFIGDIGGKIDFYRNNGSSIQAIWAPKIFNYADIDVVSDSAPAFCDIDNDGDYDLFVGNIYGNLYFYRNDGTPFEAQWTLVSDNYGDFNIGNLIRPSFGDIDGDGDYDMCIGNERAYFYSYRGLTDLFENIGTPESPSWEYMMTVNHPFYKGAYSAPTLYDIDKDSDADLFIGDGKGYLAFWRNMTITNTPPEVTISSIIPNPAYKGDNVTFNGTAEDEGDEIVAYKWTSSIDGVLSESVSFSTNTLSVGTHTITFEVEDNYGAWSEPATATLEIKPAAYELSLKDGETVSGNVYVTMSYNGVKLPFFQFMVDEKLVNSNPWRTQYFLNGVHTVYGQYPDQINRVWQKTEPITVIVNNAVSYAPEIISPKDGATLSGDVSISFRAEGATPYFAFIVANDKIMGGKILLGQQSPYNFIWKTAKFQNGQYSLKVIVYYLYAGISTSKSINVTVNNSTIPTPIINILCPNPASGIVNVHISSNDDIDFFAPTLYVDGRLIGFKWWMPCDISWDTTKFANGNHNLHFQAYNRILKKWLVVDKVITVRN